MEPQRGKLSGDVGCRDARTDDTSDVQTYFSVEVLTTGIAGDGRERSFLLVVTGVEAAERSF